MYQTGTVASPTALKTVIETFCTDNGWTLSGSDYLYKGQSNVKLTVPAGPSTSTLEIVGANSSDGLTELCPFTNAIYIAGENWPVTYYLFVQANPDLVVCVLQYATNNIQPIIFGEIVKVHNSAYVGGNWFFAPRASTFPTYNTELVSITDTSITVSNESTSGNSIYPGIPFTVHAGYVHPWNGIHVKIDGTIWDSAGSRLTPGSNKVRYTDYTRAAIYRSPNTWNSQAQLVPMHLIFSVSAGYVAYLGYVEHMRLIRIDNYEIGDIVTLGSDKWKVFPWINKNTTYRNGTTAVATSGTLGFAVRYDGP